MDSRVEAWIRLYEEEMTYARQHESLRTGSASLITAATGGVLALFASPAIAPQEQWWPAVCLAMAVPAINVLGWAIGKKHYERARRHQAIAGEYRRVISESCAIRDCLLTHVRKAADRKHEDKEEFEFWAGDVSLHKLWGAIHGVFVVLGLFLFTYLCWLRLTLGRHGG